jgi:hypothetical protein
MSETDKKVKHVITDQFFAKDELNKQYLMFEVFEINEDDPSDWHKVFWVSADGYTTENKVGDRDTFYLVEPDITVTRIAKPYSYRRPS